MKMAYKRMTEEDINTARDNLKQQVKSLCLERMFYDPEWIKRYDTFAEAHNSLVDLLEEHNIPLEHLNKMLDAHERMNDFTASYHTTFYLHTLPNLIKEKSQAVG